MIEWLKQGLKFNFEKVKKNGVDHVYVQIRMPKEHGHDVADVFVDIAKVKDLEEELIPWVEALREGQFERVG